MCVGSAAVASRATGAASWQAQRAQRLAIELPETAKQSFRGGVQREGLQKRVARGEQTGKGLGPLVFCCEQRRLAGLAALGGRLAPVPGAVRLTGRTATAGAEQRLERGREGGHQQIALVGCRKAEKYRGAQLVPG